jgi:hypothetical protein
MNVIPTRQIYDSGTVYPDLSPLNITKDITREFNIPSSRYYYHALNDTTVIIPHPAYGDPQQLKRDAAAWLGNTATIYSRQAIDSVSADIDIISIVDGTAVKLPVNGRESTIRNFRNLLASDVQQNYRFGLPPTVTLVELMYSHPFNRAANFIKASQLANSPKIQEIQNYLDECGVLFYTNETGTYGFKASDIVRLPKETIFFYLTRFYGPPERGNLESKAIERKYNRLATNETTRGLASQISANLPMYREYQNEFDLFFNYLNVTPDYPVEQHFGTHNRRRLLDNFFDYLKLLRVPNNLPLLTLNSIKQLSVINRDRVIAFLKNYTDDQINGLIGNSDQIPDTLSRNQYINSIAGEIISNRVFLMLPQEANLCINKKNLDLDNFADLTYVYIGQGSLMGGFKCYDIFTDLFDNFEGNTSDDGTIAFLDPSSREIRNFTTNDLKAFRAAAASGRGTIAPNQEIIDRFDAYIRQSELQSSADFLGIRLFRNFAAQNRELVRNIFLNFFYMGMYMRQWRGLGNPYPIVRDQTGQSVGGLGRTQQSVQENVDNTRDIFLPLFERLPVDLQEAFWNFKLYFKNDARSEIVDKGTTLRKIWRDVILQGSYCVRMASAPWAFTGAHYLKQILDEDIPNFVLNNGISHIT